MTTPFLTQSQHVSRILPLNGMGASREDENFDIILRDIGTRRPDLLSDLANPQKCPIDLCGFWTFEAGVGRLHSLLLGEQVARDVCEHAGFIDFYQGSDEALRAFAEQTHTTYSYVLRRNSSNGRLLGINLVISSGQDLTGDQASYLIESYRSLLPQGNHQVSLARGGGGQFVVVASLGMTKIRRVPTRRVLD